MTGFLQRWWRVRFLVRLLVVLAIIVCVSMADNYEAHRHQSVVGLILFYQSAFFVVLIALTFYAEIIHQKNSRKSSRS